jgi:putative SOS response-associated peptidase YedK
MCNLYSMTRAQDAMRKLFGVKNDRTGNLPSLPGIFPDYLAPVVRVDRDGERVMEMMRWGFPPPPNLGTRPVTNVRNTKSPYWRDG